MEIFSLDDAMNWFLKNSTGSIICVKDGEKQTCNDYPEARKFFESKRT